LCLDGSADDFKIRFCDSTPRQPSESRNIQIDARWAATDAASQHLAGEIIATQPDLILAQNTPTTLALLQQTTTIPIIFANVADPVGGGFVASLAQPGGNTTGFTTFEDTISAKWLELLKEVVPQATRVAIIRNPAKGTASQLLMGAIEASAPSLGI
jgi:putative ABC transport system substrate-binding protein